MSVFNKITERLRADKNPPRNLFGLSGFLANHLSEGDFVDLEQVESNIGEDAANRLLVEALVASGRFKAEDGEYVEAVVDAAITDMSTSFSFLNDVLTDMSTSFKKLIQTLDE